MHAQAGLASGFTLHAVPPSLACFRSSTSALRLHLPPPCWLCDAGTCACVPSASLLFPCEPEEAVAQAEADTPADAALARTVALNALVWHTYLHAEVAGWVELCKAHGVLYGATAPTRSTLVARSRCVIPLFHSQTVACISP